MQKLNLSVIISYPALRWESLPYPNFQHAVTDLSEGEKSRFFGIKMR